MLTHRGTQTLQSNRLVLRAFRAEDAQDMYRNWASDERVTKYLTWLPHACADFTQEKIQSWCERYSEPAYYNWAIEMRGQVIGNISAVHVDDANESAALGYCLGHDFWRCGIMPEAVQTVTGFLFSEVEMHRIAICHAVKNPASGRVAEKCGFTFEGTLREAHRAFDGTFFDLSYHGLLKSEWEARRAEVK